jgi:1-acyl-sn-glycerol-3-phosphate acyltransferase
MATTQRERNAAQAREGMEARREDADGAARKGFVRMAITAGVPIVPIATVGGPDSMPVLARLAQALLLDKVARLKMFSHDSATAKDDDYVERKYDEVRHSIQDGMDTLARRRTFPVFG